MGRYSDSEDDLKRYKKKKKKQSRSRSRSDSSSSRYSSKHKKSKKSKSKHRKRSHSRSRERLTRQSRSTSRVQRSRSRDRRSRSRDRGSRSRDRGSRSRDRGSRTRDRGSRSRDRISSRDRYRRSQSRSRDKYSHSRKRSRSDSRSRSYRSRTRSRERSRRSRSYDRRSRTPVHKRRYNQSPASPAVKTEKNPDSLSSLIPGFDDMTPSEQATARMRLALKAAAAADEKILGHSQNSKPSGYSTLQDMTKFSEAVEDIESASFQPKTFKSGRSDKTKADDDFTTHEMAIFGAGKFEIRTDPADKKNFFVEPDSYAHPNLYVDPEEKMNRWVQKLSAMRRRKIEGEAY
ncbi:serine/Arginine-related protein 53-like [Gigantopelta aegis]|uniref:serine/Arginine-related protein 53-like n=1 Tax=Gigantopelta aegis TaxID=1735272 RepID=UPI001B889FE4|nr:serine/Arginine-related protein 53-like [Gigantopelta aegis]